MNDHMIFIFFFDFEEQNHAFENNCKIDECSKLGSRQKIWAYRLSNINTAKGDRNSTWNSIQFYLISPSGGLLIIFENKFFSNHS